MVKLILSVIAFLTLSSVTHAVPMPLGQVRIRIEQTTGNNLTFWGAVVGRKAPGVWIVLTIAHPWEGPQCRPYVLVGGVWTPAKVEYIHIPPSDEMMTSLNDYDMAILSVPATGTFLYQALRTTDDYRGRALIATQDARFRAYTGTVFPDCSDTTFSELWLPTPTYWHLVNGMSGAGIYTLDGELLGIQRATNGNPNEPSVMLLYVPLRTFGVAFAQMGWYPDGWHERSQARWEPIRQLPPKQVDPSYIP